jgi:TPR repeat protein
MRSLDQKAKYWYRKAADQDDAVAQWRLGDWYLSGETNENKNEYDREALFWLQKAAGHSDAPAEEQLVEVYREGMGVPSDISMAMKWERKAMADGYQEGTPDPR